MSALLSIVIALILLGVILYLINLIPIDPTIKQVIHVVVILFIVLWVLNVLFGFLPMGGGPLLGGHGLTIR